MKKVLSIFAFERPVDYNHISKSFYKTHQQRLDIRETWPARATRRMLITDYWGNATIHFLLILGLATFITSFFNSQPNVAYFSTSVLAAIVVSIPLFPLLYLPSFNREFLPNLETVIATYQNEERAWMAKCKKDQPDNRTLLLLFYVLDKAGKVNYLSPNDKCAVLLSRIFGVATKSMRTDLDLVFKKEKREKLDPRGRVEVGKNFNEAFTILETMQFSEGIKLLKELEQKFLRP
ncbi:hypothetical protein ABDK00_007485 [Niabella insulamsoli]|uniref:hypothetical protein n=1 Tax=Niabella insulamsoli TaxID=3144874 RepID=UPI0031FD558D